MSQINPYQGDTISFPPGTPASVVSAYYNYIVRQREAEANKPTFYDRAIHPLFSDVLNPFLQEEFINAPRAREKATFATNESIRLDEAKQAAELARQRDYYNYQKQVDLENQQQKDRFLGQAMEGWTTEANRMLPGETSNYDIGGGPTPTGDYEDPYANPVSGGPYDESRQGEIAPTGGSNITTVTPPRRQSSLEAMKAFAGQDPTLAGVLAEAIKSNPNLFALIDPTKAAEREATLSNREADTALKASRAQGILEDFQRKQQELEAKKPLYNAQTNKANAQADLAQLRGDQIDQLMQSEAGRLDLINYYRGRGLNTLTPEEMQTYLAVLNKQQVRETPRQIRQREIDVAKERGKGKVGGEEKPSKEQRIAKLHRLKAREALGETLSPQDQVEMAILAADPDLQPKAKTGLAADIEAIQNLNRGGGTQGAPSTKVTPPGPDGRIKVRNKATGAIVWITPGSFNTSLYERQ